jgi:hypothetical protein
VELDQKIQQLVALTHDHHLILKEAKIHFPHVVALLLKHCDEIGGFRLVAHGVGGVKYAIAMLMPARLDARGWNLPVFQRHQVVRLTPAKRRTAEMDWPAALARFSISVVVMVSLRFALAHAHRHRRVQG